MKKAFSMISNIRKLDEYSIKPDVLKWQHEFKISIHYKFQEYLIVF